MKRYSVDVSATIYYHIQNEDPGGSGLQVWCLRLTDLKQFRMVVDKWCQSFYGNSVAFGNKALVPATVYGFAFVEFLQTLFKPCMDIHYDKPCGVYWLCLTHDEPKSLASGRHIYIYVAGDACQKKSFQTEKCDNSCRKSLMSFYLILDGNPLSLLFLS